MSTKTGYLRAAGERYTFRRRVPSHLQALAGTSEVVRALGAIAPRDAQKQARALATVTDQWFARLARGEACALAALATTVDGAPALVLARPARRASKQRPDLVSAQTGSLAFREVAERYLAASQGAWTAKATQQNCTTFRLFGSTIGDAGISDIQRCHIAQFVESMRKLPANYARSPQSARMTLPELVGVCATTNAGVASLTAKTIARHLSALSGLFSWAEQQGLRNELNPAHRFKLKAAGGTAPKRRPWRSHELATLFRSPIWTGCESAGQGAEPGSYVIRDARYWLPLMALFTGMRLEEICKLGPVDVRDAGGFWVLDVLANERGRVKEDASNRTVPVHPMLLQMGFIKHVATRREAGSALLWPELRRAGPDKRLGSAFTKWFGRYCTKIGLTDPALTFHSFRKNLATALHRAGISETIAADILGHAHKTTSYRIYSEGTSAKPLYEAICKVEYDLDLSHLVAGERP